jgi:hypothetical protein
MNSAGDIVAIGATGALNDNGDKTGHVRVHQYNIISKLWEQLGQDIDGETAEDQSGHSVSMNSAGSIVAIGAPYSDDNGDNSGHVRVYQYIDDTWEQLGPDIDGEAASDFSGWSVSMNSTGDIVAIGAIFNNDNGNNSGHVRVHQYNIVSKLWEQLGSDIDGEIAGDESGISVSMNSAGNIIAIGAKGNDDNGDNSGHVRVHQYNSDEKKWEQLGPDIDGEAASDLSGYSVSMNSEGTIIAVGAIYNDGDNGNNSGHVRVWEYNTGTEIWDRIGDDIDGEAIGNASGYSVSMDNTCTIVAIGAVSNNSSAGHTRVFYYRNGVWNQATPGFFKVSNGFFKLSGTSFFKIQ